MARATPLRRLHERHQAALIPYGPADSDVLVPAAFGEVELEYAALRKGCALMDAPDRAVLEVTGADRLAFLDRMITQSLKGMEPGTMRRSFWLNRKGRIDADMRVINLGERVLLDVDVHAADRTIAGLAAFIIADDVRIADLTASVHRLALHGPTGPSLLHAIAEAGPQRDALAALQPGAVATATIAGAAVIAARDDTAGEAGLELFVPAGTAELLYCLLLERGRTTDARGVATGPFRLRPCGWYAYNTARIEAGTPLYNIDFGADSLPHESGVIRDRVSFTKGCYLGQEIVARMESRGHSKRRLVGLACTEAPNAPDGPALPVAGAHIHSKDGGSAPATEPAGVVTSSTLSPMLGGAAICFAAVRPPHDAPGTRLGVDADGARIDAIVRDSLVFWRREPSASPGPTGAARPGAGAPPAAGA